MKNKDGFNMGEYNTRIYCESLINKLESIVSLCNFPYFEIIFTLVYNAETLHSNSVKSYFTSSVQVRLGLLIPSPRHLGYAPLSWI